MKLWAWVSSNICHCAFCTGNEVYHFDNVFFRIGEDKSRPHVTVSARPAGDGGMKALQASWGSPELPSVGLAIQAEHSSIPSSTFQPFGEYICHLLAPLQRKGCTQNSFFELTHYAFEGVRAQALSVLVLSASTTGASRRVSAAREGPTSQSLLQGLPLSVF